MFHYHVTTKRCLPDTQITGNFDTLFWFHPNLAFTSNYLNTAWCTKPFPMKGVHEAQIQCMTDDVGCYTRIGLATEEFDSTSQQVGHGSDR